MKELLAKISGMKDKNNCQVAAEAYEYAASGINHLEEQLSSASLSLNFSVFENELDEIEIILKQLDEFLVFNFDISEIQRIKEHLKKDYAESIELFQFYDLLNEDGKSYTADYAEFTGQIFTLPTLKEVQTRLSPANLKLYQKMKKEGLKPKLQITPIAYNIRSLSRKIDAKKTQLRIHADTYICDEIKDEELAYAPTKIESIKGGREIKMAGGKTKSEWIKANAGFLIDIVPTKEDLAADESIQKNKKGKVNYNAIQAKKYTAKAKQEGFTPMSCEAYLLAQMRALKTGKPLEDWNKNKTFSLLLDFNLKDNQCLIYGYWRADEGSLPGLALTRTSTEYRNNTLRARYSVRVL